MVLVAPLAWRSVRFVAEWAILAAPLVGRVFLWTLRREDRRLKAGWTYEPPTFYERNYEGIGSAVKATRIESVPGLAVEAPVAAAGPMSSRS